MSQPILDYDTSELPERPPTWVWAVFGIYLALLAAVLTSPVLLWLYLGEVTSLSWMHAIFLAGVILCGLAMVIVPVRAKLKRPIRRRSVWLPVIGSSFLIAVLTLAIFMAADDAFNTNSMSWYFWVVGAVWLAWMVALGLISRRSNPVAMSARIYKAVIVGSLLELLTAVPLHLIARQRTVCCAGIASGMAIAVGFIVAIVAIGPGVFFLFYRRWKLHYSR